MERLLASEIKRTSAELVDPNQIAFCVEYVLETPASDFVLIDDALFIHTFDAHFDTERLQVNIKEG